jgi:hypothetical protein
MLHSVDKAEIGVGGMILTQRQDGGRLKEVGMGRRCCIVHPINQTAKLGPKSA